MKLPARWSRSRFVKRLYLHTVLVPRALISHEFRDQLKLKNRFLPDLPTKIRVVKMRNWGKDISLAVTPTFRVPIDDVLPNDHPEIIAFLSGESAVSELMHELASRGYSPEYVAKRLELTPRLLAANPLELVSEVFIDELGRLKIHDGHHRAGVARALGDGFHNVIISVKVNLR